jgi:hypothetical protein
MKAEKLPVRSEHDEQFSVMDWAALMSNQWPKLRLLHAIPNRGHRYYGTEKPGTEKPGRTRDSALKPISLSVEICN